MTELMNFEERAQAVLPPHISAYYAAADSGFRLDEGTADWSAVGFQPRLRELSGLPGAGQGCASRRRCPPLCRRRRCRHSRVHTRRSAPWPDDLPSPWELERSSSADPRSGLWLAGQEGAQQVIKNLTDELAHVMVQFGTVSIDELTPDLLSK